MTQLNTLEDIEFKHEWNESQKPFVVYSDDLRAEAIKWIKELERLRVSGEPQPTAKKWVKDFFDIIEEELK